MNSAWLHALSNLVVHGDPIAPRGTPTRELIQQTTIVDMNYPVLTVPERKLNYRFLAAEAFWILSGRNDVAGIAPWNSRIAAFSDDGEWFFGAYGPRIIDQLDYVIEKLKEDPGTRQAVLTTWRMNPPKTKDVPCTVAFTFMIRDNKLNLSTYMRSNDVWLGMPYDVFNFSMLACYVLGHLNVGVMEDQATKLGRLYLTAASLHLYDSNLDAAKTVLLEAQSRDSDWDIHKGVPYTLQLSPTHLMKTLELLRDEKKGSPLRWWE